MARPKGKQPSKIVATFRVDAKKWEKFKNLCNKDLSSPTIELSRFIDQYCKNKEKEEKHDSNEDLEL